jgi:glycosyltransferase involved in cell wall biosynthesis
MNANVSVILPTFNRTRSLRAAMISVLSQSYDDLELIVVDDASFENVEELVASIGDERVRYIRREKNGGAGAARNTGLTVANGNYIAFQDSDDIWLPDKLMRQIAIFSTLPNHVGVVTGAKIIYGRDEAFNFGPAKVAYAPAPQRCLRLDEDQVGHLLSENRISLQNAMFRRGCFPDKTWFDPCLRANEDWEFAIRLAQHTSIHEDIEPVVLGFISSDSISTNYRKQTMGLLRILRKNREALSLRKQQRSMLRIDLAVALAKSGKKRRAMPFLLAGLKDHPAHVVPTALSLVRKALNAILAGKKARPAKMALAAKQMQ